MDLICISRKQTKQCYHLVSKGQTKTHGDIGYNGALASGIEHATIYNEIRGRYVRRCGDDGQMIVGIGKAMGRRKNGTICGRWTEDDDGSTRDEDVDHVGRVRI